MPTYRFGENSAATHAGTSKTTYLNSEIQDRSYGNATTMYIRDEATGEYAALLRFEIGAIPIAEVISSATLSLWLYSSSGIGDNPLSVRPLLTDWGVTDTDAGIGAVPAVSGQATYRRARDYNGAGGDVDWHPGIPPTSWNRIVNCGLETASGVVLNTDPTNTEITFDLATAVAQWHTGLTPNYGFAVLNGPLWVPGHLVCFTSSAGATAAYRPMLTVVTAAGPAPGVAAIPRPLISVGISGGIGF